MGDSKLSFISRAEVKHRETVSCRFFAEWKGGVGRQQAVIHQQGRRCPEKCIVMDAMDFKEERSDLSET